ncbi:CorA family divalent cation transporter [Streptomyces sp. NPDC086777]|uniref:CorA family divalent cation transporter n=1 Tax=Streptomyces sp. NPDC086777 TaxID=3154866 RepID=UPI003450E2DA
MLTRTRLYHDGSLVLEGFPAGDVSAHLADPASVLWLDLYRPGSAQFTMLGQEFGIHELALEDAAQRGQRPELDRCRTHEFLSAYAVTVSPDGAELSDSEIAVFLTSRTPGVLRAPAPLWVPFPVIGSAGPHPRARGQVRAPWP